MDALKVQLESVRKSIIFLNDKSSVFCEAMTTLPDISDLQTGFDVILVLGSIIDSPYLTKDQACRWILKLYSFQIVAFCKKHSNFINYWIKIKPWFGIILLTYMLQLCSFEIKTYDKKRNLF